jgi:hypothetical protein
MNFYGGLSQMKNTLKKSIVLTVLFSFLIAMLPVIAPAEDTLGKLNGFVYNNDGKKPLPDAVVLLRETVSQRVYQSEKSKKQMACLTLPKVEEKPGYLVRCKSPACFFITPCGWALVAGVTGGITYGIIKITEQQVSPTGI